MCFPGKRLKNIFSDDDKKPASTKKPSSSTPAPATTPAPASTMSSPKVAIVIYSMYGHIAKRMSHISSCLFSTPNRASRSSG